MLRSRRSIQTVGRLAAMFGLLVALCLSTVGISRALHEPVVIWPVDGVILACMLQPFSRRPWLALAIGELAFFTAACGLGGRVSVSLGTSALMATGIAVMYVSTRRFAGPRIATDSRALLRFLALIAPVVAPVAAGMAVLFTAANPGAHPLAVFFAALAANGVGYAVATPVALLLTAQPLRAPRDWRVAARTTGLLGGYAALVFLAFWQTRFPLLFTIPIGLIAVAYATDFAGVAAAVVITAAVSIGLTLMGHGPVLLVRRLPVERNLVLQAFLAIITVAALPIGALMTEHARLKRSLIAARLEAEAASQAKTNFLATISHEIRTPLNGVLGMAQAMAMDALSPPQRARIEVLQSSGEALVALLNDVLDVTKIEAGMLTLEAIEFDLARLMATTLQGYEAIAEHRKLSLAIDLGASGGAYRGDPTRLRQIVSNLVSNALKFTTTGGVRVVVEALERGLSISVSDTGIGIPADKLEHLFAKFQQADASTTRRFGGTGLGLAICRELADLMGGTIDVRSREGAGSDFVVRLPLERVGAGDEQIDGGSTMAALAHVPPARLRVLAAEDNATNQLVLRTLLGMVDVDVTLVGDGVEAVARWREQSWDVILMDVQMPAMDGPTATAIIREEEARDGLRARTPILALTANTLTHQVAAYLEAGMDGHLAKPISAPALFEALAKFAPRCDTATGEGERAAA